MPESKLTEAREIAAPAAASVYSSVSPFIDAGVASFHRPVACSLHVVDSWSVVLDPVTRSVWDLPVVVRRA